jgi:hypothetical protein
MRSTAEFHVENLAGSTCGENPFMKKLLMSVYINVPNLKICAGNPIQFKVYLFCQPK